MQGALLRNLCHQCHQLIINLDDFNFWHLGILIPIYWTAIAVTRLTCSWIKLKTLKFVKSSILLRMKIRSQSCSCECSVCRIGSCDQGCQNYAKNDNLGIFRKDFACIYENFVCYTYFTYRHFAFYFQIIFHFGLMYQEKSGNPVSDGKLMSRDQMISIGWSLSRPCSAEKRHKTQ
jgi:hypothetical protein